MDEEYLKLFQQQNQQYAQNENLNEKPQWQNLNETTKNFDQWQSLNETPNTQQYNINENLNDGWNTADFVIEKRVNGVQQQNNNPYGGNPRRRPQGGGLNGLDGFIDEDDDLREFVKQPQVQPQQQILAPPPVQNVQDADVVSVDMFENMNANALLTLANGKLSRINVNNVTNSVEDRQVRFLNS